MMKKLSILVLAAIAMVSCGNTYTAKKVSLSDVNDSMNYALGVVNGAQLKMMYMQADSSKAAVTEFIDALTRGYEGKIEELNDVQKAGQGIGMGIKQNEKSGLADNPAWTLNEKLFFQGMVNGIYNDSSVMTIATARDYFQSAYRNADPMATEPGKAITAKCMKEAAAVELTSANDSINYAFGLLNGDEIHKYLLANDSTGEMREEFISAVNAGLKKKVVNPQMANIGEEIGKTIKAQEANGLVGIPELATDFELIRQGFINALYGKTEGLDGQAAGEYIQNTVNTMRYGVVKDQGEQFLAENALKEGVTVTPSGLQYEVIKMGKGRKPTALDKVKVHYHGTLIDGTVFDSSIDRGEPIVFGLNQVIPGWTEGLQLMPIGSKFRFYIPQELAYGSREAGQIPPYSTLIFDVELLDIVK